METRVSKSSFSGIKGAKKERKRLEKSSTSYLGPGCREFESRHSDQKSRIRFCGVWTFLCVWSETRKIKSQYAGGISLPPVQTLVTTSICAFWRRCKRVSPLRWNPPVFSTKLAGLTYASIKIFHTKYLIFYRNMHTPVAVVSLYIFFL